MVSKHNKPIIGKQASVKLAGERPPSQLPLLLFTVGALVVIGLGSFLLLRPQQVLYQLKTYEVGVVLKNTILETVSSSGRITPKRTVSLLLPASGNLVQLTVNSGDTVKANQVIGKLRSTELDKTLADATDAVSRAISDLEQGRLDLARDIQTALIAQTAAQERLVPLVKSAALTKELFKIGGASRIESQTAELAVTTAKRDVALSLANVTYIKADRKLKLEKLTRAIETAKSDLLKVQNVAAQLQLKAPIAGQVLSVEAQAGQDLTRGFALLSIAALDQMRVDAKIEESAATRIRVDQTVQISVDDKQYAGRVTKVAPQAISDTTGTNVPIEINFIGKPPLLRPNTSVGLDVIVGQRKNVPTLPRAAFLSTGGERLAYVLTTADQAERREVVFGATNAERVEIVKGIELGERVITSSYEAFKDQLTIQVSKTGELK
jgi:HlyD family secretion protein